MANKPLKSIKFPGLPDVYTIESGLSDAQKESILACFRSVAWTTEEGQQLYQALYNSFYPDVRIASLSAVFTQGSRVITPTDSLNSLKQNLVVTATYYNGTTAQISDYVLSGTLAAGTSIITVIYGGKTATFEVTVTDTKNYLTIDDTENIYGFTGLTLTDGDFEYTSAKRYSLVPLKSTIRKVRTLVRSDNSDYSGTVPTWAETACTRIIFNKKSDTEYYATEGDYVYLFTKNASTQAYDATAVSDFATVQRGDRYVASGSTITVSIENGVLTVSDDLGTVMTITNANVIGWWTAEQSAVHVRWEDTEVITKQNWRYITSNDIDFQSGIVGLNVSDGDVEYTDKETTSATSFAVLMLKPSIKHIEFVYKPSGEKSLSRRPPFRIAIAKSGNNFIGCDHTSSYLFTPNVSGGEYSATKDTSLSTVTCSDAAFIGIASSGWDGYFNDKTFDVIIENGVITISGGGYYCTYSNAELIGIWIDGKPCQKLYDVKIFEE